MDASAVVDLTRESCVRDPTLRLILIAANALVAIAYVRIPVVMGWIGRRAPKIPFPEAWWLSAGFILSCASTHACAVLVFFRPAWYLEAALLIFTAVISNVTALLLSRWKRRILAALIDFSRLDDHLRASDEPHAR